MKRENREEGRPRGGLPARIARAVGRAGRGFFKENGPSWAAAISYYSVLSIFPLVLAGVSISAFFLQPEWVIDQAAELLSRFLPSGNDRIEEMVTGIFDARRGAGAASILMLLWSGSRVFSVLTKALNVSYDGAPAYGFFKRTLVELLMVITLGLLFVVAMASRLAMNLLARFEVLPQWDGTVYLFLREVVPPLLLVLVLFLVYRFVPNRKVNGWAALASAVLVTLVVFAARSLFLGYLANMANYNLVYGSLAMFAILLVWTWITASIILFGGRLTSEIDTGGADESNAAHAGAAAG